jgi:predicted alpha/beta-fold hydrolase
MRLILSKLAGAGILGVGMNFRSCSGAPNLRPRFYHSGETTDLAFVLASLADRYPGRAIGAAGYSLGGNVLLRYLGESGESPPPFLRGAVAISVPYDLTDGTACLERGGMGKIYSGYFLRSLLRKVRAKAEILSPILDLDRVFASRTVRDFDETVTAPLHGFAGALEYYREASSAPVIRQIRVPTLLLHALDDPFLNRSAIPRRAIDDNPWTLGAFVDRGGHVGFVEGRGSRIRFWSEEEAVRYLATLLGADRRS